LYNKVDVRCWIYQDALNDISSTSIPRTPLILIEQYKKGTNLLPLFSSYHNTSVTRSHIKQYNSEPNLQLQTIQITMCYFTLEIYNSCTALESHLPKNRTVKNCNLAYHNSIQCTNVQSTHLRSSPLYCVSFRGSLAWSRPRPRAFARPRVCR
jgi:hypothetical protein